MEQPDKIVDCELIRQEMDRSAKAFSDHIDRECLRYLISRMARIAKGLERYDA